MAAAVNVTEVAMMKAHTLKFVERPSAVQEKKYVRDCCVHRGRGPTYQEGNLIDHDELRLQKRVTHIWVRT